MIKIELKSKEPREAETDLFCPVFICDFCGKKVERAKDGLYCWQVDQNGLLSSDEIKISHKGDCQSHAYQEGQEGMVLWAKLSALPGYLLSNSGISRENAI